MAHLVCGVKDLRTHREVVGLKKNWDDATFQQWVENNFHPPIRFAYSELKYDGKAIGIFQISRSGDYPHVACQNIGGVIHEGQVWFRRGSKNTVALYNDLREMFRGNEPVKIARLNNPTLKHIQRHYEDQGRRTTLPLLAEKDDFLGQGYEIAYAPDTRREVWAGYHGHEYEHILMLKPVSR